MEFFISELIVPIVTALIAAIGTYLYNTKKLNAPSKERLRATARKKFLSGFEDISKTYGVLKSMVESPCVDRVLLIKIMNGGDMPRVGSPIYAKSIKAFSYHSWTESEIEENYKGVRVDDEYIKMCVAVAQGDDYVMDVESHKDCLLRDFYRAEGVVLSQVYHIFTDTDSHEMYILSVASKKEEQKADFMSPKRITERYLQVEQVRRLFLNRIPR